MSLQLDSMPQQSLPASVYVLGVRVDRVSQLQALDIIDHIIASRRSSGNTSQCQQIVTVNTEFVMAAQKNHEFRHAINNAALTVADGIGVVWATRFVGFPTPERITGTDTLIALAKRCAEKGYRLYLLGAAPGIAEQAGERLQALAPGLQIAGAYAGSPSPDEVDAIIERIHAANADILCVAYGAPAQDLWISSQSLSITRCNRNGSWWSIRFPLGTPATRATDNATYGPGMALSTVPRTMALETHAGITSFPDKGAFERT